MNKLLIALIGCVLLEARAASPTIYYFDYETGSDANNGTSKLTPKKHAFFMGGYSGSGHTPASGDQYIFKGNVRWPNAAMSAYITSSYSANATNHIYIGVDKTWYTGASWGRPIWDAQGTNITDSRNIIGSSGGTRNNIIITKANNIDWDNIEVTGQIVTTTATGYGYGCYVYSGNNNTFSNMYVHDWVLHINTGGDYGGMYRGNGATNAQAINCTVKGPTTHDPAYVTPRVDKPLAKDTGGGIEFFSVVRGCDISHTCQGTWTCTLVEDSVLHDGGDTFDGNAHANCVNIYGGATIRRNRIYNWGNLVGDESTIIYCVPGWNGSATNLVYNNLVWDVGKPAIETSESNNSTSYTTAILAFNNTIRRTNGGCIYIGDRSAFPPLTLIDVRNNLLISDTSALNVDTWSWTGHTTGEATPATLDTNQNFTMTTAQAAANSLSSANLFEPSSSISGVTLSGTNKSAYFTTDYELAARPASGAWDIGAFQLGGAVGIPPETPTGLSVSGLESTVSVSWDTSAGAESYILARSTDNSNFSPVNTNSVTGYVDSNVSVGTTYYYKVAARNASGDSAYSSSASGSPTGVAAPGPVTNLTSAYVSGSTSLLTWTASSGATNYEIWRLDDSVAAFIFLGVSGGATNYSDSTLPYGTRTYEVFASNTGGLSDPTVTTVVVPAPRGRFTSRRVALESDPRDRRRVFASRSE